MWDVGVARQLLLAHPYGQPNVLSSPGIYPDRSVDNRLEPNYDWKGIPALTSSDTKLARVYDDNNVVSTAKVPYMNRSIAVQCRAALFENLCTAAGALPGSWHGMPSKGGSMKCTFHQTLCEGCAPLSV